MGSNLLLLITLPILISIPFFSNPTCAANFARKSRVTPETICKYTPNQSYCKSMLANAKQTTDIYTYGRFSFRKAFSQSRKFLDLIDNYLKRPSTLSTAAIRALEDCYLLADLNMDYFSRSFQTVNNTSQILPAKQADDVQTRLSAILTNQQTCLDGLQAAVSAWSTANGLSVPLLDDTKLSSVLLALFKKGWVGQKRKGTIWQMPTGTQRLFGKDGRLPLIMSDENRAIYEKVCKRKLNSGDGRGVLVSKIVTVSQDGRGMFSTINDAINAAPNDTDVSNGYFLIYIKDGVYQEYVSIAKNKINLMMIGDGINQTIITGNRSAVDGWTTFNSATFAVVAPNFVAVDITFQNTAGPSKFQAVALRSGGDLSTFYSCSFEGYQDTLYTHSLRQFYRECDIYGTIDFILGNAAVVLQNCNIHARLPMIGQYNVITAQGRTDPNQNTGISIHNCTFRAADELASSNRTLPTYLGRPWKEYSRTVVMQSFLDGLINPAGWQIWTGDFALSTLYYAEYDNRGPGSNTANRVTWPGYHAINATDAANFTVSNFLLGDQWLPRTGVPYTGGLIS
ncbi:putative pectinesterase/pectinesterase inhibitor 7 [Citrus sinensis]|uniref:probable pectinesterase/pectinesterase inhibitor 20 n=1 Tax=Citrus sinensis TaxID=2711 RepID=UPI0003D746EA|nr:probable pectinesterase/pectinesterase inhibitor 20 [Citrus sinensis]KAH9730537.1 putative pectinesterase/pectinesterase inhibitor 7 [Citrus sinensis]